MTIGSRFYPRIPILRNLAPALFTPGSHHVIPLRDLHADGAGRVGHITNVTFYGAVALATVGASMAEAGTMREVRRLFRNVKLRVAGHELFANVDGLDIQRYVDHLRGATDTINTATIPAANGTPTVGFAMTIPFIASPATRVGRHDRVLPAALFNDDAAELSFDIANTLAAGITVTSITSLTMAIGIELRDRYNVFTPWKLFSETSAERWKFFRPRGALDLVQVCSDAATAAGRSHANYTIQSILVGGEESMRKADMTAAQWEQGLLADELGQGQHVVALTDPESLHLVQTPYYDRRATKMTRGAYRVEFSGVPSFPLHRYLVCETGEHTEDWVAKYAQTLGVSGESVWRTVSARSHALEALVAQELAFDGSPSEINRAKVRRA